MNSPLLSSAQGFARRVFRVADLDRMVEAGVIGEDERLELIDGEIVEMASKGNGHELVKTELNMFLGRNCPRHIRYTQEAGWRVDEITYLEPDFLIYPAALRISAVAPEAALLVIELAASSLAYDMGVKAALYARMGVRDYWVINVATRDTTIHRAPEGLAYSSIETFGPDTLLTPLYAEELAFSLDQLDL